MLTNAFLHLASLGAEWVMWLLMGISVLSVYVIIERFIYFRTRRLKVDLVFQLESLLLKGQLREAKEFVADSQAPECRVVAEGLQYLARGQAAMSEAMLSAKAQVRLEMERYLGVLGTIGSNAPFVGLLGTVLGIIKASHEMQLAPASEAASGAAMSGVFEALVATAVGLLVAIPAVVAFNYFQRLVRSRITHIDSAAHLVLAMAKPGTSSPASAPAAQTATPTNAPVPPPPPKPVSPVPTR